jgi:predicted amidohydrolase
MKVGFAQLDVAFREKEGNVKHALDALSNLKADLIVLPELFNTGYCFPDKRALNALSEDVPDGETTKALISFSKKKGICVVAGLAEKEGGRIYNSAVIVDKKFVGAYRKVHLYATEKKLFTRGDEFKVFPIRGIKLGVMICFDWFYPESMRTLALSGAELIAHPANLVMPYCPDSMKTRCLENRVWAVTADRIGHEGKLKFIGKSQVASPLGEVVYRASEDREEVKVFDIDVTLSRNKNLNKYNNIFEDRKPDSYRL